LNSPYFLFEEFLSKKDDLRRLPLPQPPKCFDETSMETQNSEDVLGAMVTLTEECVFLCFKGYPPPFLVPLKLPPAGPIGLRGHPLSLVKHVVPVYWEIFGKAVA